MRQHCPLRSTLATFGPDGGGKAPLLLISHLPAAVGGGALLSLCKHRCCHGNSCLESVRLVAKLEALRAHAGAYDRAIAVALRVDRLLYYSGSMPSSILLRGR